MISLYMDCETSGTHCVGNMGSDPLSMTLRSSSQRLKDSAGAEMPEQNDQHFLSISVFLAVYYFFSLFSFVF